MKILNFKQNQHARFRKSKNKGIGKEFDTISQQRSDRYNKRNKDINIVKNNYMISIDQSSNVNKQPD